jgi:hypothetical protein
MEGCSLLSPCVVACLGLFDFCTHPCGRFGLSYCQFTYSGLVLNQEADGSVTVVVALSVASSALPSVPCREVVQVRRLPQCLPEGCLVVALCTVLSSATSPRQPQVSVSRCDPPPSVSTPLHRTHGVYVCAHAVPEPLAFPPPHTRTYILHRAAGRCM